MSLTHTHGLTGILTVSIYRDLMHKMSAKETTVKMSNDRDAVNLHV